MKPLPAPNWKAKPKAQYSRPQRQVSKMHSMSTLTVSRDRAKPASRPMTPACMKKTRKAVTSTQTVFSGLTMSSAFVATWRIAAALACDPKYHPKALTAKSAATIPSIFPARMTAISLRVSLSRSLRNRVRIIGRVPFSSHGAQKPPVGLRRVTKASAEGVTTLFLFRKEHVKFQSDFCLISFSTVIAVSSGEVLLVHACGAERTAGRRRCQGIGLVPGACRPRRRLAGGTPREGHAAGDHRAGARRGRGLPTLPARPPQPPRRHAPARRAERRGPHCRGHLVPGLGEGVAAQIGRA